MIVNDWSSETDDCLFTLGWICPTGIIEIVDVIINANPIFATLSDTALGAIMEDIFIFALMEKEIATAALENEIVTAVLTDEELAAVLEDKTIEANI